MPKYKKTTSSTTTLPNYSQYEYADLLPPFNECDRMSETNVASLICYDKYEIEGSLNQFTDQNLNDHLYMIFCKKGLEMPGLIGKLVIYFADINSHSQNG